MLAVSLTILRNKIASGLANKIHSLPFGLYRFLPSLRWKLEDALKASEESEPRSDYRGGGASLPNRCQAQAVKGKS